MKKKLIVKILAIIFLKLIFNLNTFAAEQTKARYEKIAQEFTKNTNVKIKPSMLKMKGLSLKESIGYLGKGEMAVVKGSPESAFKGKEFYQIVIDYSNCVKDYYGHNDCNHSGGVTRSEVRDKNKPTFSKGTEKWIHYAVRPMQNFFDSRKKHISQCYAKIPGRGGGYPTFFLTFRDNYLWVNLQQAGILNSSTGNYNQKSIWAKLKNFDGKITNNFGASEWTSILVHMINRSDKKGLIEIFIDGSEKPTYKFEGPLYSSHPKEKPITKCYLKIGAVAENNKRALQDDIKEKLGEITENMVVWYDSLVIGKTRKKVMDNVEKDK